MDDIDFRLEGISKTLGGRPIDQICFLVPDLAEGVRRWKAFSGETVVTGWSQGPEHMGEQHYHGKPGKFGLFYALMGTQPQVELIQPLDGDSIYHDWIRDHGYGFHHIGYRLPSIAEPVAELQAAGYKIIQSAIGLGPDGSGAYAYVDLEEDFGVILELIQTPTSRWDGVEL